MNFQDNSIPVKGSSGNSYGCDTSPIKITGDNDRPNRAIKRISMSRNNIEGELERNTKRRCLMSDIEIMNDCGKCSNIVKIVDTKIDDDSVTITTEIDCEVNLVCKVDSSDITPLTEEEIWLILSDIINGVSYLHNKGISHRDIRPETIHYSSKEECYKIEPVGLHKTMEYLNEYQISCGSQRYWSPEMISGSGQFINTKSSDIWAIGIIALELCIGRRNVTYTLLRQLDTETILPLFKDKSYQIQLIIFIIKCLTLNVNKRADIHVLKNLIDTRDENYKEVNIFDDRGNNLMYYLNNLIINMFLDHMDNGLPECVKIIKILQKLDLKNRMEEITLDFSGINFQYFQKSFWDLFTKVFEIFNFIVDIKFSSCLINKLVIKNIVLLLPKFTSLKKLNLSDNMVDDEDFILILRSICTHISLEYLNFSKNRITDMGIHKLIQQIDYISRIKNLNFSSVASQQFFEGIDLSDNNVSPQMESQLYCTLISQNKSYTIVELNDLNFDTSITPIPRRSGVDTSQNNENELFDDSFFSFTSPSRRYSSPDQYFSETSHLIDEIDEIEMNNNRSQYNTSVISTDRQTNDDRLDISVNNSLDSQNVSFIDDILVKTTNNDSKSKRSTIDDLLNSQDFIKSFDLSQRSIIDVHKLLSSQQEVGHNINSHDDFELSVNNIIDYPGDRRQYKCHSCNNYENNICYVSDNTNEDEDFSFDSVVKSRRLSELSFDDTSVSKRRLSQLTKVLNNNIDISFNRRPSSSKKKSNMRVFKSHTVNKMRQSKADMKVNKVTGLNYSYDEIITGNYDVIYDELLQLTPDLKYCIFKEYSSSRAPSGNFSNFLQIYGSKKRWNGKIGFCSSDINGRSVSLGFDAIDWRNVIVLISMMKPKEITFLESCINDKQLVLNTIKKYRRLIPADVEIMFSPSFGCI